MTKANYKLKILIIVLTLFLGANFLFANENIVKTNLVNYEEIYQNLPEADFDYIFGIDPDQTDEYTKFMFSPYPLFRTGVKLVFKSTIIPPGYYLLTPREKNGTTWVLFKENGRVSYVIPAYKIKPVPMEFYEEQFPSHKPTLWQKMSKNSMEFIGKHWGHKNQRTPIPKAYIEFDDRGLYWDMVLYYGDKKYYLLFKKDSV